MLDGERLILIIEDDSKRMIKFKNAFKFKQKLTYTNNVEEAIDYLSENKYDIIFFDHDLGPGGDAIDIAKWMYQTENINGLDTAKAADTHIIIHSMNPVGAKNIQGYLKKAKIFPGIWNEKINEGFTPHFKYFYYREDKETVNVGKDR